jgi:hypothetical protein
MRFDRDHDCEGIGEPTSEEVERPAAPGVRAIAVTVPRATAPY